MFGVRRPMPKGGLCCVCAHPRRDLVELALVHKLPVRVIAKRFELSKDSRFSPPAHAHDARSSSRPSRPRPTRPRSISSSSSGPKAKVCSAPSWPSEQGLQLLSELCFEAGELGAATSVERAITNSLELTSKLLGMIVGRTSTTNILISSDYLRLRGAIVAALKPFPEASRAVGTALAELELEAAADIASSEKPLLLEASPC